MDNKYVIGIDAGGTKVAYGLFDKNHKLIDRVQHPTNNSADGPKFSDELIGNIKAIMQNHNITFDQLDGVGIGMPSFINRETGHIFMTSAIPQIKDFAMLDYVQSRLPTRIVLDNDANAATLAEHRRGAGRGTKHMVYIVVGTGFGSGIIINNEVFTGSYGGAGECGHMLVTPGKGFWCGCENTGCFMSYISGRTLPERVKYNLQNGATSMLDPKTANGKKLLDAYNNGDELAYELVKQMANYIALCVYNVYQMLNIDTYVFGGGLTALGDALFIPMREEFDRFNHVPFPVNFKLAELKEDIGIIGAAEYIFTK